MGIENLEGDYGIEIVIPHNLVSRFLQGVLHFRGTTLDYERYVQVGIRTCQAREP